MIERKHLVKLQKSTSAGGEGLNFRQSILCAIALGEKSLFGFSGDRKAQQVLYGFRRYKFVRRVGSREKGNYRLTPKGEIKLRSIIIDEVVINNPKNWDGKWRLVMYDLPIRFKKARNAFRWKLKDLGFFQLQKSVWLYPYPCEAEILMVADFFGVRGYIEILEVNKILNDKKLRKHFGLRVE
jgi:hypothetical protein